MKKRGVLLLSLVLLASSGVSAWAVILSIAAPPILSIEDDTGPFTLTFTSFLKGSQSDTRVVNYRVRANNMTSGTFPGASAAINPSSW